MILTRMRMCLWSIAHLDPLAVYKHGLHGEIDADGVAVTLDKRAGPESLHHASLASTAIADQHDLEQVVEALVVAHHQIVGVATRHSLTGTHATATATATVAMDFATSRMTIYAIAVSTSLPSSNCVHFGPSYSAYRPAPRCDSYQRRIAGPMTPPPTFPSCLSAFLFDFFSFARLCLSITIHLLLSLFKLNLIFNLIFEISVRVRESMNECMKSRIKEKKM